MEDTGGEAGSAVFARGGDGVVVATLAGSAPGGFTDGDGASAKFYRPWGITVGLLDLPP